MSTVAVIAVVAHADFLEPSRTCSLIVIVCADATLKDISRVSPVMVAMSSAIIFRILIF